MMLRRLLRRLVPSRSVRPTREGRRFVLLTLGVGIAAVNTGNNLLYLLLAMMLSLIVVSGILSEQCVRGLEVRRRMPSPIFANRPATASLSVANRKARFPTLSLEVLDVAAGQALDRGVILAHLPPGARALQSYPLLFPRRGVHRLEGVRLRTRFPFGLFAKSAFRPLDAELVVFPELTPLPEEVTRELAGLGRERGLPRRGPGAGLYNLRDYQPGDDSRLIHWRTAARHGRLIVRETEAEVLRRARLVLATARPGGPARLSGADEAFERAVSFTASLAVSLHERGFSLSLVAGREAVPFGAGSTHLHRLLHVLALCGPAGPDELPTERAGLADGDDPTLLVLPWPDARPPGPWSGAVRVFRPGDGP
jgi:uncharacterized protein (DUF58 family)